MKKYNRFYRTKKKENPEDQFKGLNIANYRKVQSYAVGEFGSGYCEIQFPLGYIHAGGRGNWGEVHLVFKTIKGGPPEDALILSNAKECEVKL